MLVLGVVADGSDRAV